MYNSETLANLLGIDCGECAVIVQDLGPHHNQPTAKEYLEGLCDLTGYQPLTDYYMKLYHASENGDLSRCYYELWTDAQTDYRKLTELTLMLNWLIWYYSEINEIDKGMRMQEYWEINDHRAFDVLHGEELDYFIRTLD